MFTFARVSSFGSVRSVAVPAVALVLGVAGSAMAQQTYIALGDSIGFGTTSSASYTQFSNGDRGYVAPVADWLAGRNGGVRPDVFNLSIFGDSTASFFDTSETARVFNTNYSAPVPAASQASRFGQVVAQSALSGRPVTTVTISLGANDLLEVVQAPGFLALPPVQQGALVFQALSNAQTNLASVYGSAITTRLPRSLATPTRPSPPRPSPTSTPSSRARPRPSAPDTLIPTPRSPGRKPR